jgi:hypothetical protein
MKRSGSPLNEVTVTVRCLPICRHNTTFISGARVRGKNQNGEDRAASWRQEAELLTGAVDVEHEVLVLIRLQVLAERHSVAQLQAKS